MKITFLHTNPYHSKINDLIIDIVNNTNESDFMSLEYPYLFSSKFPFSDILNLRSFLKKNKVDVLHTFGYVDAYVALFMTKCLNVKVVLSDYFFHDELKGIKKWIYRRVLKKVDHIIFQSDYQKKIVSSNFNIDQNRCSKILHAFCFKRYDSFIFNSIRDEFFIDNYRYLIGSIGDFAPERDIMGVFKMIKKLRRSGRNFTCVMAGNHLEKYDSYYNTCKYYYLVQGLDNYITYIGGRDDDANVLSQLDAFVYCSEHEAVAIQLIEAMVSGVNVIANDNEMIREITSNGKYAVLYEKNNDMDFAAKTRDVLLNLEDNKMITEVVKEETREIFSISKHIKSLKEVYTKLN